MEQILMTDLEAMVEKGRELQTLLTDTPEILSFLELMRDMKDGKAIMPVKTDTLILAGQAASILSVDKATIYRYVREGILRPYYTPHSSYMKFWLSDVKAVPQEVRTA